MTRLAFLGPSLSADDARAVDPDVLVLPPAGMGDMISAARRHQPTAVALIDGTFLQNMSVFHKEILHLLSDGIRVVGASSMGAIRAAEMQPFGMIGVGQVFRGFADGSITDDDEVALSHTDAEDGYRTLSEAMVNIRATLDHAVAAGILTREGADVLARLQMDRWFPERSLPGVLLDARRLGTLDEHGLAGLEALLRAGGINVKRADALEAIAVLRDLPAERVAPAERPAMSISSAYLSTLDRDVSVGEDDDHHLTFERIRFHCALNDADFEETWRRSLRRGILLRFAAHVGVQPDEEDRTAARTRILTQLGCDPDRVDERLRALDMTAADFDELVTGEALILRLERWLIAQAKHAIATRPFLNELRLSGRYEEVRRQAGLFDALARRSPAYELSLPMGQLMGIQAGLTGWEIPEDLDAYIEERALGDRAHLYDQLMVSVVALHELFAFPLEEPPVEPETAADAGPDLVAREMNTRGG